MDLHERDTYLGLVPIWFVFGDVVQVDVVLLGVSLPVLSRQNGLSVDDSLRHRSVLFRNTQQFTSALLLVQTGRPPLPSAHLDHSLLPSRLVVVSVVNLSGGSHRMGHFLEQNAIVSLDGLRAFLL